MILLRDRSFSAVTIWFIFWANEEPFWAFYLLEVALLTLNLPPPCSLFLSAVEIIEPANSNGAEDLI